MGNGFRFDMGFKFEIILNLAKMGIKIFEALSSRLTYLMNGQALL